MATSAQVQELTSILSARAHALRSVALSDIQGFTRSRERLLQAFSTARAYRGHGQGAVPSNVWSSFEATLRSAIDTLNSQDARRTIGAGTGTFRLTPELETEARDFMVFTPEQVGITGEPAPTPAVTPPRRTTPRQPAYVAPTTPAAPSGKQPGAAPAQPTTTNGMPPTGPPSDFQPAPQSAFMALVNPQDRPIYLRPWFIGAAGVATVTIIGSLISIYSKPEKPKRR